MAKEPLYLILLGPPGSGKGTQAQHLEDKLGLVQVASGDLFREHLKKETKLGKTAKVFIDKGELVPDEITIKMVMERLANPDCQTAGAILDGFPRNVAQAQALDRALSRQNHSLDLVVSINVPDAVIVDRLSGRWICSQCRRVYNASYNPPAQAKICDVDKGQLYQRIDDQSQTVLNRLQVYQQNTKPLVDYYKNKNILVEVDGNQPITTVSNLLQEILIRQTCI